MRIGILANSLPAAMAIDDELKAIPGGETFILLCRTPGESRGRNLCKHVARWLLTSNRLKSLRLSFSRRVFLFQKPLDHPDTLATLADLNGHRPAQSRKYLPRADDQCFSPRHPEPAIGILPEYRGRNVMEWALVEGGPVGMTVFFIDSGIDTGERIVLQKRWTSRTADRSGSQAISLRP